MFRIYGKGTDQSQLELKQPSNNILPSMVKPSRRLYASLAQPYKHQKIYIEYLFTLPVLMASPLLRRKPTLPPQPTSLKPKPPYTHHTHNHQPPKQTPALPNPKRMKQRRGVMDTPRRDTRPNRIVHREQTRAIHRVCECKVDENDLEDQENRNYEQDDSNRGHDPVDVGTVEARPREHEECGGRED